MLAFTRQIVLLLWFVQLPPVGLIRPPGQPAGEIRGRVTSGHSALPGAVVMAAGGSWWSEQGVSDAEGRYSIARVPPGTYTIWFRLEGFNTAAVANVTVDTSIREVNQDLTLAANCPHCEPRLTLPYEIAVRIETTAGDVTVAIDPSHAPITAANFLKYVDGGFYTSGRFHRATRDGNYTINLPNRPLLECIQAGINPERRSEGFAPIPLERTTVTGLRHVVGTVSMARGGPDSATSDFFILLNDQPSLDFGGKRFDDAQGAAAFGRVVAGMDVVRKIQQQPTEGQSLTPPVQIISVKRVP